MAKKERIPKEYQLSELECKLLDLVQRQQRIIDIEKLLPRKEVQEAIKEMKSSKEARRDDPVR